MVYDDDTTEGKVERRRRTRREKGEREEGREGKGTRYNRRIRDRMSGNSKTSQTTSTGASSLGIAVIPRKCAISSVIGYYYAVITGSDLG